MSDGPLRRGTPWREGRTSAFLLLAFILSAILLTEWRHRVVLDRQLGQREALIQLRQELLALERDLLLARSDEAEIISAGRFSLVEALLDRLSQVEDQRATLEAAPDSLGEDLQPLGLAMSKYRRSVEAELKLLEGIGFLGQSGQLQELRSLEKRLLDQVSPSGRGELLELQLLEREFAATLMTSKALALLDKVDALRLAPGVELSLRDSLGEYRNLVEAAMSNALELELLRSESSLRFNRLPAMFRRVEQALDDQLGVHLVGVTQVRRNAGWMTAALLVAALLTLAFRIRQQRLQNLRLQDRIASLADGMQAFAAGEEQERLDLPRSGRLGSATESFLSMASQIRLQIETIRSERNRAEEASRVKSDFLARVSHELRTPLHGILGMAEILLQSRQDERQEHLVRSISRSGSTLLSVVNDLLDYSRLEAGRLALVEQAFDLVELCETQLAIHSTVAQAKGLELIFKTRHRTVPVLGDPLRMGQVLTNLLGNAIKFTDEGQVELLLGSTEAVAGGLNIEIEVRDSGPGVPAAARSEIFESFSQAAPVARRRVGGSGLGLSIVQELLALMDGEIRVEDSLAKSSRGGPGVAFVATLTLPESEAIEESPSPLSGRRLILVDAHEGFSEALACRLELGDAIIERYARAADVVQQELVGVEAALLGVPVAGGDSGMAELRCELQGRGLPVLLLSPAGAQRRDHHSDVAELPRICRLVDVERTVAELLGLSSRIVELTPPAFPALSLRGRILLVEDNAINRDVVQLMLEDCGCEMEAEENGRLAVERLRSEAFDLVLMDCHMPEMDGYESTRRIRQLEAKDRSNVPILALTASVLEEDLERCRECGMDEVLSKPVSQRELIEALKRWLGAEDHSERPGLRNATPSRQDPG